MGLESLLASKMLYYILGPIFLVIAVYIKGRHDANKSHKIKDLEADKELNKQVNKAERKINELEGERQNDIETSRRTPDSFLTELWRNKGWGPKGSSKPSDQSPR